MAAPTPMRFFGGLLTSPHGPPTFIVMDSTRVFRWCLMGDPSRKVGAGRTAELCFPTPPSKPGGPVSEHRAFQGVTFQAWDFSQVCYLRRVRCRPSAPTEQPVGPNSRALGSY